MQSYELSVNRATDRLNYYVSGGFYDQDGIAQSSTFRRYNMRANAEVKASNWLKIGTNTMMAYEEIGRLKKGIWHFILLFPAHALCCLTGILIMLMALCFRK